ncbi:DUF4974 domain-containing protein [Ilyomonas limi]|uniref:DUF4974 domain-containing protein n=1 Tax=Ilyomonas limi TaxID=2575867 RepID=A0A4U3L9A6_9BACT|nr:FecR domain-containing protein [Ilyomonas limi]TKK71878.1 DUF4974 domain-containing protein [Ilyomonas limi]
MTNNRFTVEELMLDDSFIGYCLGKDATDIEKWEAIINVHADYQNVFAEAKQLIILLNSGLTQNEIDKERQWIMNEILKRKTFIIGDEHENQKVKKVWYLKASSWAYISAAACILFIVFMVVPKVDNNTAAPQQKEVFSSISSFGEHKKVLLPDSTTVMLNSNSSISWNSDYNSTNRLLSLRGTAFFKVAKNPHKPFIVQSGTLFTTALGTAFYVQQSAADNTVAVSLLEGKISVEASKNTDKSIVYPGQQIIYSKASANLQKQSFDTLFLHQLLTDEISFTQVRLKEVMAQLAKWYNVNIEVQNPALKDKLVTGVYKDISLEDLLKVLSFSMHFTYTKIGNTIIIQ